MPSERMPGDQMPGERMPGEPPRAAPRLTLRPPTDADAERWFELFDDPEIMRYVTGGETHSLQWYRDFAARQRILAAETGVCLFALVVGETVDEVAGFVGLQPWSRPWGPVGRIEVGWRLGRSYHGRGLATAGARFALDRAKQLGILDPVALIDVENAASIRVATKLGMTCETLFDAPTGARVGQYSFA